MIASSFFHEKDQLLEQISSEKNNLTSVKIGIESMQLKNNELIYKLNKLNCMNEFKSLKIFQLEIKMEYMSDNQSIKLVRK